MSKLDQLKSQLIAKDLWAKKSLGQNFLIDDEALAQIVEALGPPFRLALLQHGGDQPTEEQPHDDHHCHQFTEAELLREVVVEPGRSYFDTNISDHHHFFHEDASELTDIPASALSVANLPATPEGTEVKRVDVIIRLKTS